MVKYEKVTLTCPKKGYVAKCVKIPKPRSNYKKKVKQLLDQLPEGEQQRLQKLNKKHQEDKAEFLVKAAKQPVAKPKKTTSTTSSGTQTLDKDFEKPTAKTVRGKATSRLTFDIAKLQEKLKNEGHGGIKQTIRKEIEFKKDLLKNLLEKDDDQDGKGKDEGLFSSQIDDLMKSHSNFVGTIAADQIPTLELKPKMAFIINTDKAGEPGTHGCAVYVDSKFENEINYYDPFGNPPSELFMKDIKTVSDKLSPARYLKMKINTVKNQDINSDNCGWHCIRFLEKRFSGEDFKQATGFKETKQDNSEQMEDNVEKYKEKKGFKSI